MKNVFILILLNFNWTNITAQTNDPWAEYMTPSDVHSVFGQYAGSFKMEITMSMSEGKEPVIITMDSENTLLLGGRFLEMKQQGNMMGMAYNAITTAGFNNTDKKFALTTITNMGTGTLSLSGDWDHTTKTANLFGQLTNPVSKEIINVRQTVSFIEGNCILIESFDREGNMPEKKTVQYKFIRI